jgi:hypothetical protein
MLGGQLKTKDELIKYREFDFSNIWLKTENVDVYGVLGDDHQRIRVKILSVKKNPENLIEYLVVGKSMVNDTISDFQGVINLTELYEVSEMHFGVDDEYAEKGIKSQGVLIAEYEFQQFYDRIYIGIFKGKLFTKWYMNSNNQIEYDNIEFISDGYMNNAFVGNWKSKKSEKEMICNWGDYRVPNANFDFDIGAGEFSVSEKYWNKGWLDVALKNQIPNNSIEPNKTKGKSKEWWE